MNPNRFDSITRSFSSRVSRRTAFRAGGAGLAATVLAGLGFAPATARQAGSDTYTVIRKYKLTGTYDQVTQEINNNYLPSLQQEAGFLQYSLVASSETDITTITVFASQDDYNNASSDEADWVAQNLASIMPAASETISGDAVIWAVNTDEVCNDGPEPTEAPPPPPTEAPPTEEPTEEPCTGIGCNCNGGVEGDCDEGLVCCQSQMGGGPIPGGAGMCAAEDACGDGDDDGATPAS